MKIEKQFNIIVICSDEKGTDITYYTDYLDGSIDIGHYLEHNCFATKEQAQAECDRRNNAK